jgi:hypothetical protein
MQINLFRSIIVLAAFSLFPQACSNTDTSVLTFLDQAMTQSEIDSLQPGDPAYAMVDREDGIRMVPITLGHRYTSGSVDYLTFKDDNAQFGYGDSGTPILNSEGKTMGALSGTYGGDNIVITPISAMLASVNSGTLAAAAAASSSSSLQGAGIEQNKLAWFATGVDAEGRNRLRSAGIPVSDLDPRLVLSNSAGAYAPQAAVTNAITYSVAAGRSMAVVPFSGPMVNIYAIGTATHAIDHDRIVAFGHSLNWDGQPAFNMPVTPAKIVQFVHDPVFGSFKLAVPVGEIMGGIVQDRSKGILISRTANVSLVELKVSAGGSTTTHRISRLDDQGMLASFISSGLTSVVQDQLDIGYPGYHQTSITVTHTDGTFTTSDLGMVNWSGYGGWQVWDFVMPVFSTVNKIEVTVN